MYYVLYKKNKNKYFGFFHTFDLSNLYNLVPRAIEILASLIFGRG